MDTSDHGLVMVDDRTNLASHFWSPLLELQRNRDMLEVAVWRHAIHWNIEKSGTLGEPPQFNCGNTMAGMESTEFNCKILRPQSLPKLRVSCFFAKIVHKFPLIQWLIQQRAVEFLIASRTPESWVAVARLRPFARAAGSGKCFGICILYLIICFPLLYLQVTQSTLGSRPIVWLRLRRGGHTLQGQIWSCVTYCWGAQGYVLQQGDLGRLFFLLIQQNPAISIGASGSSPGQSKLFVWVWT